MPAIVPRLEVEKELKSRHCNKIKEYGFGSASLWQTRDGKLAFSVPKEIGGWTRDDDLRCILEMLDSR